MAEFIKNNWKYLLLILLIVFLLRDRITHVNRGVSYDLALPSAGGVAKSLIAPVPREVAPVYTQDRLVIKDTSLSLVVKDVTKTIADIETVAKDLGGYLVNSYLSRPEEGGSGTIVVRVPESRRAEEIGRASCRERV